MALVEWTKPQKMNNNQPQLFEVAAPLDMQRLRLNTSKYSLPQNMNRCNRWQILVKVYWAADLWSTLLYKSIGLVPIWIYYMVSRTHGSCHIFIHTGWLKMLKMSIGNNFLCAWAKNPSLQAVRPNPRYCSQPFF